MSRDGKSKHIDPEGTPTAVQLSTIARSGVLGLALSVWAIAVALMRL